MKAMKSVTALRHIQQVTFEVTDPDHAKLVVKADGPVQAITRIVQDPTRLYVEIPNSKELEKIQMGSYARRAGRSRGA